MQPQLTIGMVTYNEQEFIEASLKSLLNQTYSNFELLISDNASTDSTADICLRYAHLDKRIKFTRNPENIGSSRNFNKVFSNSATPYFMWAGGHDLWEPTFVEDCLKPFKRDNEVVTSYCRSVLIDTASKRLGLEPLGIDTRGLTGPSRFHKVMLELGWCDAIYGIMRSDALRKTKLFRRCFAPDNILLAELSLLGTIAYSTEPLFLRRLNRAPESARQMHNRVLQDQNPSGIENPIWKLSPYLTLFLEHLRLAINSENPIQRRLNLAARVIWCFGARAERNLRRRIFRIPNPNIPDFLRERMQVEKTSGA